MFEIMNKPEEIDLIVGAMRRNIVRLSMDNQGHHVVKKVLSTFKEPQRNFIVEESCGQFMTLAKDSNGLCVIKELIHTYKPNQKGRE